MWTAIVMVFGIGLSAAVVGCGGDTADPPALDRSDAAQVAADRPTDQSTTSSTTTSTTQSIEMSTVPSTIATTIPAPPSTIYNPPMLVEGGTVVAEIRSIIDPSLDPSRVQFRLVEFEDGPFLETSVTDLASDADAALWSIQIDGRLRAKFTYPGGRHGSRISPEQYSNGITVVLFGTDEAEAVVLSTEEVAVPPP